MSYRRAPNPKRFEHFQEFTDGKGFTIYERGKEIDFYYDHERGWFDEHGNYYDADGRPNKPSQQSKRFWDQVKKQYPIEDDLDEMLNEYEAGGDDYDDDDQIDYDKQKIYYIRLYEIQDQVKQLQKKLKLYPDNAEIPIYYKGLNWRTTEQALANTLGKEHITRIIFDNNNKYKNGQGTIFAKNKASALEVIKKHRAEIDDYTINFEIEAIAHIDSDEEIIIPTHPVQQVQQQPQPIKQSQPQQSAPKEQPPQQQQQPQAQKESSNTEQKFYYVVLDKIPASESKQQFQDWLVSKTNQVTWVNLEIKAVQKDQRSRLHFKSQEDADKFKAVFGTSKIMYKGKQALVLS